MTFWRDLSSVFFLFKYSDFIDAWLDYLVGASNSGSRNLTLFKLAIFTVAESGKS